MRNFTIIILLLLFIQIFAAPLKPEPEQNEFVSFLKTAGNKIKDFFENFDKVLEVDELLETAEGREELVDKAIAQVQSEFLTRKK